MRVHVVDPPLFTLPYDTHFCHALAEAGAEVTLVGRGLRAYEKLNGIPFAFRPLFYRHGEAGADAWRTSPARRLLKGIEHLAGLRGLLALAAEERPDIVHLQWFVLPAIDRQALRHLGRRAGLVLTVHDSQTFHGARHASRLQLLGNRAARLIFDHYVVHTGRTRDTLRALGIEDRRISVLPHPPLPLAPAATPAVLPPAGGHAPRILFFGSIKRYKGVDVLIEAGLRLAAAGRDFVIDIAGRPFEPMDALRARIAAAGAEHHFRLDLRYIPNEALTAYLAAADLVVFPYRQIDASGALALAVEAGRPIVASELGVFAEEPARRHLRLVPPGDPAALAAALEPLIASDAARRALAGETARLRAAMPSWRDFAQACLAVYRDLGRTAA